MSTMTREEILAEIKASKRSIILKTGDNYHDLRAHTVQNFDEFPYHVQQTPHELIVINRKRQYPRPKENDLVHKRF
jgi:hypothetical protein